MADNRMGTGTTITLGTTDYTVNRVGVSSSGASVETDDASHLGSDVEEILFGKVKRFGELAIEANLDPDELDNFKTALGLEQTVTLTFPTVSGETSGATMAGTGAIINHSFDVNVDQKITCSFTIKWKGDVTFTDAT